MDCHQESLRNYPCRFSHCVVPAFVWRCSSPANLELITQSGRLERKREPNFQCRAAELRASTPLRLARDKQQWPALSAEMKTKEPSNDTDQSRVSYSSS